MKWIKFTERECDLFTVFCIAQSYINEYKKNIGKNFSNYLAIYREGVVHSYRNEEEFDDILSIIKTKGVKRLGTILDNLNSVNSKLEKFLEYKELNKLTNKELACLFRKLVRLLIRYFSLFTLPKYYGLVFEREDIP